MLKYSRYVYLSLICLFSVMATAAEESFQLDKDYRLISPSTSAAAPTTANKKIKVTEFFSYGCPWCYKLESELGLWLLNQPKNVDFERVAVIFEPGWPELAKAYYITDKLGLHAKMNSLLFMAVQLQGVDLSTQQALQKYFVENGVTKQAFEKAYADADLEKRVKSGDSLMREYQIYEVPSFVVDGKYKTNMALASGDSKKLLRILDFLINKASKENK
ncbi:thiol:disulfide interchange protein DsbA/DsbL [soil metagenome]